MIQFVTPALLFGAALFTVPLIIHLLNRQRFRRRAWAAMDFLLAAYKKQRQRLRRENLILLLLRCLIPILLALALARPQFESDIDVVGLDRSTHHVFVFDHGYSMDLQLDGGSSPFERSKQLAQNILDQLSSRGAKTSVSILTNGLRSRIVMRDDLGGVARAESAIAALPLPVDGGADLGAVLLDAADLVEETLDSDVVVHVLTDLQTRAFGSGFSEAGNSAETAAPVEQDPGDDDLAADAEAFEDPIGDAIRRIQAHPNTSLTFFDTRSRSRTGDSGTEDNTQVLGIEIATPAGTAIAHAQVPVIVRIAHRGESARSVEVTLEIDGSQPMRRRVDLPPGEEVDVEFPVTFASVGQHRLEAIVEQDMLAVDDRFGMVVGVRDRIRTVLVEGRHNEPEPDLRLATFLRQVLDPTGGVGPSDLTTFAPRIVDSVSFLSGRDRLDDADLVVLCGVERINDTGAETLRARLEDGTGVWIVLHPQCDPDSYNAALFREDRRDPEDEERKHTAASPLPVRLNKPQGFMAGGDEYFSSEIVQPDHPVFADLQPDVYREIFAALPVTRFFGTDEGSLAEAADVLMRVRDPFRSPLLVASSYGDGRVLLMTSGQSRRPDRWNNLENELTAFPFVHRAAYWLSTPTSDPFNVTAGQPLTALVARRPEGPTVVPPERAGGRPEAMSGDVKPQLGDRFALPPYTNTEYAGFYRVQLRSDGAADPLSDPSAATELQSVEDAIQAAGGMWFAVRPEIEEGELVYASHQQLREQFGIEDIRTVLPAIASQSADPRTKDLGPLLVLLTLFFLLGEAGYARWIARHRS